MEIPRVSREASSNPCCAALEALFWPQRAFTPPQLFGAEELGSERRRLLFVGNHAILGIDVSQPGMV